MVTQTEIEHALIAYGVKVNDVYLHPSGAISIEWESDSLGDCLNIIGSVFGDNFELWGSHVSAATPNRNERVLVTFRPAQVEA